MPKFALGWKRQANDPRDRQYVVPRRLTASLPTSFDLSAGMGEMLDQGDLGSCGPNSAAEMIDYNLKAEGLPTAGPSRLFIYYITRLLMNTVSEDSGVDNRTMLKALNKYGYLAETLMPYDQSKFTESPTAAQYTSAIPNAIQNYAVVNKNLAQMKGTIVTGRPFLFGFDVFQQMMSDQAEADGIIMLPSSTATSIGGHDVTFYAFDDKGFGRIPGGAFKFRNHWRRGDGKWWGDNGSGYIGYDYATGNNASDFWVINGVPGNAPITPPGPIPPVPVPIPTPTPAGFTQFLTDMDWRLLDLVKKNPQVVKNMRVSDVISQVKTLLDAYMKQKYQQFAVDGDGIVEVVLES